MKNIERGSIKHLIILIVATAICGMIIYPLFDFVLCNLITNSKFIYSIHSHIIEPIIFGCVMGIILWILEKKQQ